MSLSVKDITSLYATRAAVQYGREAINQYQHALQCAHLAESSGAAPELVAAALLHDLGHLVTPDERVEAPPQDRRHQDVALPLLRGLFAAAVLEPVRLHVDAKRYLCHVDAGYWATLSPASQRSLALQGGPFNPQQAHVFITQPFAADAVALRRWDDQAKDPAVLTPDWAHYEALLDTVRVADAPVHGAADVR